MVIEVDLATDLSRRSLPQDRAGYARRLEHPLQVTYNEFNKSWTSLRYRLQESAKDGYT